jgi:hypothetical protein
MLCPSASTESRSGKGAPSLDRESAKLSTEGLRVAVFRCLQCPMSPASAPNLESLLYCRAAVAREARL